MNTDQDFTFTSPFTNEASNVMFVVINFNSRCTATSSGFYLFFYCHTKEEEDEVLLATGFHYSQ